MIPRRFPKIHSSQADAVHGPIDIHADESVIEDAVLGPDAAVHEDVAAVHDDEAVVKAIPSKKRKAPHVSTTNKRIFFEIKEARKFNSTDTIKYVNQNLPEIFPTRFHCRQSKDGNLGGPNRSKKT